METENTKLNEAVDEEAKETPLCLRCLCPVDPFQHYCSHCGEATGQLTQYIPFVNIRWQAGVWGDMWQQVWSKNISVSGRILRFLMIVWCVPILLVGLLFKIPTLFKKEKSQPRDSGDDAARENNGT